MSTHGGRGRRRALGESRVLEYDLVRQVRAELNGAPTAAMMRGVFEADFRGHTHSAHFDSYS